jgi:hypothetical protein
VGFTVVPVAGDVAGDVVVHPAMKIARGIITANKIMLPLFIESLEE